MFNCLKRISLFLAIIIIAGCDAQNLYTYAIDYERGRADLEVKSIELDYGQITYLDNGVESDTTIVLLHGFGGDKDNWNRFSAELDGSKRIIIPDLPGHGDSVLNRELDYSIANQAKMLSIFLDAIKVKQAHIMGNSMGGAIAIRYSVDNSKRVQTLTLIDPLGLRETKSEFELIVESSGSNPMLNVCSEEKFNTLLHFGMEEPPFIPGMFMDLLVAKKCSRASIEKIVYEGMHRDADLSGITKNVKVPTIIIWGKKDRVLHVDNAQLFHRAINGSKLVVLDDIGHVALLESPEITAQVVEMFIR